MYIRHNAQCGNWEELEKYADAKGTSDILFRMETGRN
jgi:hypothetical protein